MVSALALSAATPIQARRPKRAAAARRAYCPGRDCERFPAPRTITPRTTISPNLRGKTLTWGYAPYKVWGGVTHHDPGAPAGARACATHARRVTKWPEGGE